MSTRTSWNRLNNSKRSSVLVINARVDRTSLGSRSQTSRLKVTGRYFPTRISNSNHRSVVLKGKQMRVEFARGSEVRITSFVPFDPNAAGNRFFNAVETASVVAPLAGGANIPGGIAKGATSLTVGVGVVTANTWYFLRDQSKLERPGDSTDPMTFREIGGELVYVTGWNAGSKVATLRNPTTQSYAASANVVLSTLPASAVSLQDLSIHNLVVRGVGSQGFGAQCQLFYADNVTVSRFQGLRGDASGVSFAYSRQSKVARSYFRDLRQPTPDRPWGYSIQLARSVSMTVVNCSAINAQYCVTIEGGSAAATVTDIAAYNCPSSFDIHGGDARDILVTRCVAPVPISLGNTTWRRGAFDLTLTDCLATELLFTCAIRKVMLQRTQGERAVFTSLENDTNAGSAPNVPDDIIFNSCKLINPSASPMFSFPLFVGGPAANYRITNLKITNCELESLNITDATRIGIPTKVASNILIESTTIKMVSATNSCLRIVTTGQTPANSLEVRFKDVDVIIPNARQICTGELASPATTTFFNETNGGTTPNRRSPDGTTWTNLTSADVGNVTWASN